MEISLVLPAYNEKNRLKKAVRIVESHLDDITESYEIIIAEDGSTDGTDSIAKKLAKDNSRIVHIHSDIRQGRGKALKRAFLASKGDILAYIDVDLATDMKHLKELISAIRDDGYDIATGSRLIKQSSVKRGIKRNVASIGFNLMTRVMLGSKIKDHQCGFKSFRRDSLMAIIDKIKDEHWFWDTEMLVIAQKAGYKIKEFPINWQAGGATTVHFTRDVIGMGSRIITMWLASMKESKANKSKNTIIGLLTGLGILIAFASFVGIKDVMTAISSVSIAYILASSAIYILSFILRGLRFDELLEGTGKRIGVWYSTKTIACSQWANLILPARMGDFLRPMLMKKDRNVDYSKSFGSLLSERIFDMIAIIILGLTSLIYILGKNEYIMPPWITDTMAVLAAMLIVIIIPIIIIIIKPKYLTSFSGKYLAHSRPRDIYTEEIISSVSTLMRNTTSTIKSKKIVAFILINSLAIWFIETMVAYTVALSMNITLPIEIVFLAVSLGNITKAVPNTPNALGTYEAAVAGVLIVSGITPALSFSVALIDHFIKNIITFLAGSYAMSSLNFDRKNIEAEINRSSNHKTETNQRILDSKQI